MSISIKPFQDDIRLQMKVSQNMLEAVRQLQMLADSETDPERKKNIEKIVNQIGEAGIELVNNVRQVSRNVVKLAKAS